MHKCDTLPSTWYTLDYDDLVFHNLLKHSGSLYSEKQQLENKLKQIVEHNPYINDISFRIG